MAENKDGSLWGIRIWDDTGISYYTEVEVSQDLEHNVPVEVTVGYNKKFPFVTHNGIAFYYSGSCSGKFANNTDECIDDYDFEYRIRENGDYIYNVKYMNGFVKWLDNKHVKYLQLSEQLIIPCNISSPIKWSTETTIDDGYNCSISFDWVQADEDFSLDEVDLLTFCPYCKHQVAPFAYYCQNCGKQITTDKSRIHTGCFNDDGEITFRGTLYNDVNALNAELSKLETDTTNTSYETKGFMHSIVVFNPDKSDNGICSVISVARVDDYKYSRYFRRIWVDDLIGQKTTTDSYSMGSNIGMTSVQWKSLTENATITSSALTVETTANKANNYSYGITITGTSKGNKYIIITDYWKPYSMRTTTNTKAMTLSLDDEIEVVDNGSDTE